MKKIIRIIGLSWVFIILNATAAWAGSSNVGQNLSTWLTTNVTGLFPPILAVVSLVFLFKREFTRFLGFIVFALIVAVFVYSGETTVKTFAQDLARELLK